MAECLDYSVYVKQRMDALGLSLPSTWFDGYDQMMSRLTQLTAISTLNPTASVLAVRGVLPILGVAILHRHPCKLSVYGWSRRPIL